MRVETVKRLKFPAPGIECPGSVVRARIFRWRLPDGGFGYGWSISHYFRRSFWPGPPSLPAARTEASLEAAERSLRGIAVGRKNWLFAGSDQGGHRAASIYSLVETARLNGVDPEAWLADTISRIADHPARRVAELLPWNYRPV